MPTDEVFDRLQEMVTRYREQLTRLNAILDNVEQRCSESAVVDMKLLGELVRHQRQGA